MDAMGYYGHRLGFCRAENTQGFHVRQRFPLLGLLLSIFIFSVIYLGLNINSLLGGDVVKSPSVTVDVSNSCSILAQDNLEFVKSTLEQQRVNEEIDLSHCNLESSLLTKLHLLDCATHIARQRNGNRQAWGDKGPLSRVAFLFVAREELPHEPLWRRYFYGQEELYSLYTHNTPKFGYLNTSLFYGHQVPSQGLSRLSTSLVDSMLRLLAYALLDPEYGVTNSWFVFLCDSSIPIRSFDYTYDYLTKSKHSFVGSFLPLSAYLQWTAESCFHQKDLRKDEMWMALEHRHAITVLEYWRIYYKLKSDCGWSCGYDEQYVQTLLALQDPHGIANRTVMFGNWCHVHASLPFTFDVDNIISEWIQDIQDMVVDKDEMYHENASLMRKETNITSRNCHYNGIEDSPCFLFARNVASSTTKYLENLSTTILGY